LKQCSSAADIVSFYTGEPIMHSSAISTPASSNTAPDTDSNHDTVAQIPIASPLSQTFLPRNWMNETILPHTVDDSNRGIGYGILMLMCRTSRKAVAIGSMMVIGYGGI
jgi:hypothetical protein